MATKQKPTRKPSPEPAELEVLTGPEDELKTALVPAGGLTGIITKAEFEQGVELAHRYPRSIPKFLRDAGEIIARDQETAEECIYAVPRVRSNGTTEMIRGPSARFAETIGSRYKNCRALGQIVEESGEFVTAQGTFLDLEYNGGVRVDVRRRITNRFGQRFSPDMIQQTGNAAVSIALRNAVLKGIPKGLWKPVYAGALVIVAGKATTLAKRREKMLEYLAKQGITEAQVLARLGLLSVAEMSADDLLNLHGLATAMKEGDLTPEQAFKPQTGRTTGSAGAREALAEATGARDSDAPTEPEPAR